MSIYQPLYQQLEAMGLDYWSQQLQQTIPGKLAVDGHGSMAAWQKALHALPDVMPSHIDLKAKVEIGIAEDLGEAKCEQFAEQLNAFHPWRKGPFSLFGVDVDTEWRSDWKWDRLLPHIQPLAGRKVLDIGSGNGYHGWRMIGEEASLVIGIDPGLISVMQYQVVKRYLAGKNHYVLPLGIEDLPQDLACFDTVFSMGVLYHRRSPLDHLFELRACLRSGAELVLETLIIAGEEGTVLVPEGRYAKMRNVWFIPSVATLLLWLRRCGFKDIRCVYINTTTIEEQRHTEWMSYESLADFLDPEDHSRTIEGYPAPCRAIFTATAP